MTQCLGHERALAQPDLDLITAMPTHHAVFSDMFASLAQANLRLANSVAVTFVKSTRQVAKFNPKL